MALSRRAGWLMAVMLMALPPVSAVAEAPPCWFYEPSPEGVAGAIGISRTLTLGLEPLQLARIRAAERVVGGMIGAEGGLNTAQRAAIIEGETAVATAAGTVHLAGEFEEAGYIYAYATLQRRPATQKRCPRLERVRPEACEPRWLCAPVQPDAVGFAGVSGRASSPEDQFRYAIGNALRLLEYTYGVQIEGEQRFLETSGALGGMRLRLSEYTLSRNAELPAELRLYVREVRRSGPNLYVWLVSPDLQPYPVPQDLGWRERPSRDGFIGEVGVARPTWDGRLSTQIDLAVRNALFALAQVRGADVTSVHALRQAAAGTVSGRATLIRVQNELSAQLLGLHIESDGPVYAWMGWREKN